MSNAYLCAQSAEKQGNQLHMNVYKMKGQACGGPLKTEVKELKGDLRPAPPYPSRVKTVDKGTQVTPEREAVRNFHSPAPHLEHSVGCCLSDLVIQFAVAAASNEITVFHCLFIHVATVEW